MNIKVIYRNYIPLYSGYCSFWLSKIPGISFEISKPKIFLNKFYNAYRLINKFPFFSNIVHFVQKILFSEKSYDDDDWYFYTGMLPIKNIKKPYVIDFEHIHALFNFGHISKEKKKLIFKYLSDNNCKWILPWSIAAKKTLRIFSESEIEKIEKKVKVLYPALPNYKDLYKNKIDHVFVKNKKKIKKFLFIGKEYRRKGLIETLIAFTQIFKERTDVELYCVTPVSNDIKNIYNHKNIFYFKPEFTLDELITKFFMTCDVFILPTHADTFGMVLLEALSCGMPVITTKQFAGAEIVNDGKNGLLLNSGDLPLETNLIPKVEITDKTYKGNDGILIDEIIKKVSYLCQNWNLVSKMSLQALIDFKPNGKFSISTRNKKLKALFLG